MEQKKPGAFKATGNFIREVQSEMKKVVWPSRGETYGSTAVVIVVTVILCAFLAATDGLVATALSHMLRF
jgi:preprotein translocase subunit SecE